MMEFFKTKDAFIAAEIKPRLKEYAQSFDSEEIFTKLYQENYICASDDNTDAFSWNRSVYNKHELDKAYWAAVEACGIETYELLDGEYDY